MKVCGKVEYDSGRNYLDIDGDPDAIVDPGSLSRILCH